MGYCHCRWQLPLYHNANLQMMQSDVSIEISVWGDTHLAQSLGVCGRPQCRVWERGTQIKPPGEPSPLVNGSSKQACCSNRNVYFLIFSFRVFNYYKLE